ncbi:F-box/kelch-repeat protein At3g06240-like [Cornus florida]|uniref:F-box/kelch-repeat protein At3g06240-like n=1 Tax=Cornus florida TaxID=4283 RepID=UPI00289B52D2|nr:F-box/kelch-repeat protein At3g06240-like [Cornus florida]
MEGKLDSTQKGEKEADESHDEQIQILGCSITDLPSPILVSILTRLPVKNILICKCVTKTWVSLISDPHFAKLHFARAEPSAVLRTAFNSMFVSRLLYLVEPERCNNFVHCDHHVNMKLETKLKILLRNVDMFREVIARNAQMRSLLPKGSRVKRKRCPKFDPSDYVLKIVNSCNGLLCLSEPKRNKPVVVFNPITDYSLKFPTYLNGGLHWVWHDGRRSDHIVSFNFDDEQLQSVPLPPLENDNTNVSMGVLEGCLCISDSSSCDSVHVWVLNNYGAPQFWTKVFSLNSLPDGRSSNCLYQPISYQKDGAILIFDSSGSALIYYDPEGPQFRYLKIDGVKLKFEAIAYVPSFISLKDTVVGECCGAKYQFKFIKVYSEAVERALMLEADNKEKDARREQLKQKRGTGPSSEGSSWKRNKSGSFQFQG